MKNVITLITILAIFAHAVAGCCWHFEGDTCCSESGSSSVLCLADSHAHVHDACGNHPDEAHAVDGHALLSVHRNVAHADDSPSQGSDSPHRQPGRHCEDKSCVVVFDTLSTSTQFELNWLSGHWVLVPNQVLVQIEISTHGQPPTNSLWSPLDRALAHQVLLI